MNRDRTPFSLLPYYRSLSSAAPLSPKQELQVTLLLNDLRRELAKLLLSLPEGPRRVEKLLGRKLPRRAKHGLLAAAERAGFDAGDQVRAVEAFYQEPRYFRRQPDSFLKFHRMIRLRERLVGQLIMANARLVIKIAREFRVPGMEVDDLIQEGNLGLLRSLEDFDYRRGLRFSTYAAFWIKQFIVDGIHLKARTVKIPRLLNRRIIRLEKFRSDFFRRRGRLPGVEEIYRALGLAGRRPMELHAPVERLSLEALIESGTPDEAADPERLRPETMEALLKSLPPRERSVLESRYGLFGLPSETLSQMAKKMSLSKERVRQIERQALERLSRLNTGEKD